MTFPLGEEAAPVAEEVTHHVHIGSSMTKREIIAKTMSEILLMPPQMDAPYGDEPYYDEAVIATLKEFLRGALPETNIKTCDEFGYLKVTCCSICHGDYPHFDICLVDIEDAVQAWICCAMRGALFPERYDPSPEDELIKRIFGRADQDSYLNEEKLCKMQASRRRR